VYPATISDSASAKSNGARFVSNKNVIIINPIRPKKTKMNQMISCSVTIGKNEKQVPNNVIFKIIKPIKISRFNVSKQQRIAPSIEYLFLLK
jgi:hypothetical protein